MFLQKEFFHESKSLELKKASYGEDKKNYF